jgi:hypothetical protein
MGTNIVLFTSALCVLKDINRYQHYGTQRNTNIPFSPHGVTAQDQHKLEIYLTRRYAGDGFFGRGLI